jgi:hypothetical protein
MMSRAQSTKREQ